MTNTNHSGGAYGADSMFDKIGRQYGFQDHRHYYHGRETPLGNVLLSDKEVEEGIDFAREAAKVLARPWNPKYSSLLGRNWFQVKNSTQIVAIAALIKPGELNDKGYKSRALRTTVDGGTGYAVEMGIATGREVNVFDIKTNKWFKWNGKDFVESEVPTLHQNYAGVGSRQGGNMTKESIQAIINVYKNTLNG